MQNPRTHRKSASFTITALLCLMGLLALPSAGAAWDYQVRYMVPADDTVAEYCLYWSTQSGVYGEEPYYCIPGPKDPNQVHTYDLNGLPDYQDVAIVMTSCRYVDGALLESHWSNELFFPVECTMDSDCSAGEICDGGSCIDAPVDCINDSDCDDGDYCNGVETCVSDVCVDGSAVDCSDGVSCTIDACNEVTDSCDHTPNDAFCANGLFCDGVETCDLLADCQPGPGDPCPDGYCHEANDICVECLVDSHCDNGVFCDGDEICVSNTCQYVPRNCSDGVSCTVDVCNEVTDSCDHTVDDDRCDNGLFCDGVEFCDASLDCQPGPVDPCPDDVCDEANDICVECLIDSHCDNGVFCDGDERCVSNTCQDVPRDCSDGVGCTVDTCNESANSCDHDNVCGELEITGFYIDPPSPQPVGTTVTLAPDTTGGSGNLEYKWVVKYDGDSSWSQLRDFGLVSWLNWAPDRAGSCRVGVHVRSVGSDDVVYVSVPFTVTRTPPISVGPFVSSPSIPDSIGVTYTVTASASGGTGNLEYKWVVRYGDGQWQELSGFGSSPSFAWTPAMSGTYRFGVHVQSVGRQDVVYYSEPFTVTEATAPPPDSISVDGFTWSPSTSTPDSVGVTYTVTAAASGGTGNLEYSWHVKYGDVPWQPLSGFGPSPSFVWTPTTPGPYKFGVHVQSVGRGDVVYYSELGTLQ